MFTAMFTWYANHIGDHVKSFVVENLCGKVFIYFGGCVFKLKLILNGRKATNLH